MWKQHTPLILAACLASSFAAGCSSNPCDEYVSYMCDCHPESDDTTCDELRTVYEDADVDLQDQCAIELDNQQEADETAGHTCGADESDSGEA